MTISERIRDPLADLRERLAGFTPADLLAGLERRRPEREAALDARLRPFVRKVRSRNRDR